MYEEMMALGLVSMSGTMSGWVFLDVTPLGHWAVQRHEIEEKGAAESKRAAWAHDAKIALLGAVAGGIMGLFSGALSGWIVSLV
jgi:hypothetical protein